MFYTSEKGKEQIENINNKNNFNNSIMLDPRKGTIVKFKGKETVGKELE